MDGSFASRVGEPLVSDAQMLQRPPASGRSSFGCPQRVPVLLPPSTCAVTAGPACVSEARGVGNPRLLPPSLGSGTGALHVRPSAGDGTNQSWFTLSKK